MKKNALKLVGLATLLTLNSCDYIDDFIGGGHKGQGTIKGLRYIDEYIISDGAEFEHTTIGGLSGLDYANGTWYLISDDANAPIRFYTASMIYDGNGFTDVSIESVNELKDKTGDSFVEGTVDPEAIRLTDDGNIIWSSEGNINNGVSPFIRFARTDGNFYWETKLDEKFKVSADATSGPRHNGTFEGISLSHTGGFWAAMELPLVQDGPEPSIGDTDSPVRIVHIDEYGSFGKEFVYELGPVVRKADETSFTINGIVEILEYDKDRFLVLERSFSTGFADGGNDVKIYDVDATNVSDVSKFESLSEAIYKKATKKLLFDFEDIRSELTDGIVDNIEGISFGPELENGSRSLVLVADNNFSAFGPQLNQFVVFEVEE